MPTVHSALACLLRRRCNSHDDGYGYNLSSSNKHLSRVKIESAIADCGINGDKRDAVAVGIIFSIGTGFTVDRQIGAVIENQFVAYARHSTWDGNTG